MFLRIPQQIRSHLPLTVHVVEIPGIMSRSSHSAPYWRRHKECVTPPPYRICRVVRDLHKLIELCAQWPNALSIRSLTIEPQIGLPNGLIVRMHLAGTQRPSIAHGSLYHYILVTRGLERFGSREQADIERCKCPILAWFVGDP